MDKIEQYQVDVGWTILDKMDLNIGGATLILSMDSWRGDDISLVLVEGSHSSFKHIELQGISEKDILNAIKVFSMFLRKCRNWSGADVDMPCPGCGEGVMKVSSSNSPFYFKDNDVLHCDHCDEYKYEYTPENS